MSTIIFIVILVVLIIGHEFGHLIVAKLSGMKVPEFGLGFPPKLWGKKIPGITEFRFCSVLAMPQVIFNFGKDSQKQIKKYEKQFYSTNDLRRLRFKQECPYRR